MGHPQASSYRSDDQRSRGANDSAPVNSAAIPGSYEYYERFLTQKRDSSHGSDDMSQQRRQLKLKEQLQQLDYLDLQGRLRRLHGSNDMSQQRRQLELKERLQQLDYLELQGRLRRLKDPRRTTEKIGFKESRI